MAVGEIGLAVGLTRGKGRTPLDTRVRQRLAIPRRKGQVSKEP